MCTFLILPPPNCSVIPPHPSQKGCHQGPGQGTLTKMAGNGVLTGRGGKPVQPLQNSAWRLFKSLQTEPPCDPAQQLLVVDPKDWKSTRQRDTCTAVFITTLFIGARTWNRRPMCPPTGEQTGKVRHVYTAECQQRQRKKWHHNICRKTDRAGSHCVKRNKPGTERQTTTSSLICGKQMQSYMCEHVCGHGRRGVSWEEKHGRGKDSYGGQRWEQSTGAK